MFEESQSEDLVRATLAWIRSYGPCGLVVTGTDMRIRAWNRWMETGTGSPADSVLGLPLLEVFPEIVERGFVAYYAAALQGGTTMLSHRLHGSLVHLRSHYETGEMLQSGVISPLVLDGRIVGTVTVIEDVSERVEREERLSRQVEWLEAGDAINRVALSLDPSSCAAELAQQTVALMRARASAVVVGGPGGSLRLAASARTGDGDFELHEVLAATRAAMAEGAPVAWCAGGLFAVRVGAGGGGAGALVVEPDDAGIPPDATRLATLASQAAVGLEAARLHMELQESLDQFRHLVDALPSAVLVLDCAPPFRPIFLSRRVEALIGRTVEEMKANPAIWSEVILEEDLQHVWDHFAERFDAHEETDVLCRALHSDAVVRWVRITGRFLGGEGRGSRRWQGLLTDVTAVVEAERVLREAKDAAEGASRAKSEFLATISHEIRTPLNAVIGMNDLLLETELTGEQRDYAETSKTSAEALLRLLNDLLDLAKIEAGRVDLERTPIDLAAIGADVVRAFAAAVAAKGLGLSFVARGPLPGLMGDPGRVRQILANLVGNAMKFTAAGGIAIEAECRCIAGGLAEVTLAVRDTGIGIPAGKLDAIFDKFVQADASTTRRYGGTGLGLAISRQLAESMGGGIGARSEPGVGSTFEVTLRLEVPEGTIPAMGVDMNVASKGIDSPSLEGTRVLVVDDIEVNRKILAKRLSRFGCEVVGVADGADAVSRVLEERFDLVLMDCQMPGMDGFEATSRIRSGPRPGSATPVVAITASAMAQDVERCLEVGMNDFLAKPIRPEGLRAILDRWVAPAVAAPSVDESLVEVLRSLELELGPELFRCVAREFQNETEGRVAAVRTRLRQGNCGDIAGLVHAVKGSSMTMQADALAAAARRVEGAAAEGDLGRVAKAVTSLEEEFGRLRLALDVVLGAGSDLTART